MGMFRIKNPKETIFIICTGVLMLTLIVLVSLVGKNLTYTTRFTTIDIKITQKLIILYLKSSNHCGAWSCTHTGAAIADLHCLPQKQKTLRTTVDHFYLDLLDCLLGMPVLYLRESKLQRLSISGEDCDR